MEARRGCVCVYIATVSTATPPRRGGADVHLELPSRVPRQLNTQIRHNHRSHYLNLFGFFRKAKYVGRGWVRSELARLGSLPESQNLHALPHCRPVGESVCYQYPRVMEVAPLTTSRILRVHAYLAQAREVISIHIGQGGIQLGNSCWEVSSTLLVGERGCWVIMRKFREGYFGPAPPPRPPLLPNSCTASSTASSRTARWYVVEYLTRAATQSCITSIFRRAPRRTSHADFPNAHLQSQ